MSEPLVLYIGDKNISSWSMRAWGAVIHKRVPFEERLIPFSTDRDRSVRRKVSPTGKVPVLHHGNVVVPDSLAIVEYLEDAFPAPGHPSLWPADPAERARARWLAAAMHSGYELVRRHMSFNICFLPQRPEAPPEAVKEAHEVLALWEGTLTRPGRPAGPFLCGELSAADVMFAPMVVRFRAFGVPSNGFPAAATWMDVVLDAPPARDWLVAARKLPARESY